VYVCTVSSSILPVSLFSAAKPDLQSLTLTSYNLLADTSGSSYLHITLQDLPQIKAPPWLATPSPSLTLLSLFDSFPKCVNLSASSIPAVHQRLLAQMAFSRKIRRCLTALHPNKLKSRIVKMVKTCKFLYGIIRLAQDLSFVFFRLEERILESTSIFYKDRSPYHLRLY
jgi:hypothetical protein